MSLENVAISFNKTLAFLVLSLVFIYPSISQAKTDREQASLFGEVRSVIIEDSTWAEGDTVFLRSYTFDTKGNMIESELYFYKVGGSIIAGSKLRSSHTYNAKKTREEVMSYREDGSLVSKDVSTFDPNGNMIERTAYNAEGAIASRFVHRYDRKGNDTETISYKPDGSIYARYVNTYDEKGNLKETTAYKGDKSIDYKAVYTNDEKGPMTESLIYKADGSLDEKRVYAYNEKGYQKEMAVYNPDGSLREKETDAYEFDSVGNWIKKTTRKWVSKEGKLEPELPYVIKRTITYY